jgi:hypothetical protein
MLDFFIAVSEQQIEQMRLPVLMSLSGPVYWYLHRYFVHADLNPGNFSFLNLYEDTEMSGYQLHRFQVEMKEALADLASRPSSFPVLVGWSSSTTSMETEEWKVVQTSEVRNTIQQLLALAAEANEQGSSLFALGD